jgi:condensin complex subunit 3
MAKKKNSLGSSNVSMTMARCLNEAQRSISVHKKLVRVMCLRLVDEGAMSVLKELAPCLAHLLLVFSRDTYVERAVRFVIQFVTNPVDQGEKKLLEEQESLIEALLSWLLTMTKACEKSVRYRSCQLIAGILSHMPGHVSLPNALLEQLQNQIRCRLKDKVPQVRAQAARALARFQEAGEDNEFSEDPITEAYSQMVARDRNKEVRKVVLASIAVSTHTLKSIFMHTRDTCDSVRRTAYLVLASKVPMSALSIKQRNEALRRGLNDRMPAVKQAAVLMLKQWFKETQEQVREETNCEAAKDCDSLMHMLDMLDVESYESECEILIKELLSNNLLNSLNLIKDLDASEEYALKREMGEDSECLTSACALVWRVLCETINQQASKQGQAAALTSGTESAVHASQVTQKLDALEKVLPASADSFVSLIDFHVTSEFGLRFVVKQLLLVACHCVDFADGMSHMHGEGIFKRLAGENTEEDLFESKLADAEEAAASECGLFCQGSNGKWEEALMKFGAKVYGSSQALSKELIALVMSKIGSSDGAEVLPEDLVQGCMLLNTCFEICPTFDCIDVDLIPEIAGHLMDVCVPHEAVAVRKESIKLCGMLMLHSNCSNQSLLSVFTTALMNDHYQVKIEAAKFFIDLAHTNGPKYVLHKLMQNDFGGENQQQQTDCPIKFLQQCLDLNSDLMSEDGAQEDKNELRKVIVEGFLKLLTHNSKYKEEFAWNEGEQCEIFSKLVFLNFDKECGDYAPIQQCLSVFFDVYSMLHPYTYQIVAASIVLIVKEAIRKDLRPRVFGQLSRFLVHLVQRTPIQKEKKEEITSIQQKISTSLICEMSLQVEEDCVWEEEEEQMKQIIPTLLKILQKLDVHHFTQDALGVMKALLARLPEDNKLFSTKDFAAVVGMYNNDLQIDVVNSPQLQEQAKAVYKQYAAIQGGVIHKSVPEPVQTKKKEETRRKSSLGQCEEKENGTTTESPVKKALTKASPPPPTTRPRRALRSNNSVNA